MKEINSLIKEVNKIHGDLYSELRSSIITRDEYDLKSIETTIRFIGDVEAGDSFDLIANYPELIHQCGVVSASFDNGCLTDVPD